MPSKTTKTGSTHQSVIPVIDVKASQMAVLIDADNITPDLFKQAYTIISSLGQSPIRWIYGNFQNPQLQAWQKVISKYGLKPMHQPSFTKGKNATDIQLVIDAMDLIYIRPVAFDTVCLLSSDSDFTGLAIRLREQGLQVLGFGEDKAPDTFKQACEQFFIVKHSVPSEIINIDAIAPPLVLIETPKTDTPAKKVKKSALLPVMVTDNDTTNAVTKSTKSQPSSTTNDKTSKVSPEQPPDKQKIKSKNVKMLLNALQARLDKDGWCAIATFGQQIQLDMPGFSPKVFGYATLSKLILAQPAIFKTEYRVLSPANTAKTLYLQPV